MRLTIELPDDQADLFADWASVRRTLTQAMRTTSDENCAEELEQLTPAIEAAQFAVRDAVWKLHPDRSASRKKHRLT